jgi:hypothetical protein
MKKLAAFVIVFSLSLFGCSTSVDTSDERDGLCTQSREKSFLGITYSKTESFINCEQK